MRVKKELEMCKFLLSPANGTNMCVSMSMGSIRKFLFWNKGASEILPNFSTLFSRAFNEMQITINRWSVAVERKLFGCTFT
jgi:hypothetical protein